MSSYTWDKQGKISFQRDQKNSHGHNMDVFNPVVEDIKYRHV